MITGDKKMGFNILLRLQLAYWFLCSDQLKQEEPSIDLHVHAVAYLSLIVFAFLYGCRSLIMLLFDLSSIFEPYVSVAVFAFIAVGGVYASSIYKNRYLQGKLFIESVERSSTKGICIKNGFLLIFIGVLPQIMALIYMAVF